jgi:DHA1 family bicyclomycin/chloramphenicol resistance-like MFS transporter
MLAPTIGGYVTCYWGWHMVFFFLMCMGIFVLITSQMGLPKTYEADISITLKPKPIISNFVSIIKVPQFYTYALTRAIAFSGLFTYVAASPILFMDILKVDATVYGWIFAFMSVSFIGSSQLNSLLLRRFTSEQIIFGVLITQIVISSIFLILVINDDLGLYETITMFFLFLACLGISNQNTACLTLAPFAKNTGSASALMGATQLGIGALTSFAVGVFVKYSMVPMVAIITSTTIIAFVILNIGKRKIKRTVVNSGDD